MLALVTFYTLNILSEKRIQERPRGGRQRLSHIQSTLKYSSSIIKSYIEEIYKNICIT
jgi:hypothetical protein